MDARKFLMVILLLLMYAGISPVFAQTEGRYRVDISVLTQGWAYPSEEITVQAITFFDKTQPPEPGQPPQPLSPGDWVDIGNVPLMFEAKGEAGNPVDLNMPQGLRTDNNGFLETTFNAPSSEGKYTIFVYAVIEGVECSDSDEFTVSAEERILPTVTPTPTPASAPTPTDTIITVATISVAVVVTAILGAFLFKRRKKTLL